MPSRDPRAARRPVAARLTLGALGLAALVAGPRPLAAQDGCAFGDQGNDVLRQVSIPGGETVYYVTRPHLVCDGGIQIWADSAVAYTATNLAHLIGSVRYEDPTRALRAAEARYFSNVGRLQAEGALRVEDRDEGSVIENGALVYLRSTSFRAEESMTVTVGRDGVRPRATVVARERGGEPTPDPTEEPGAARTYVVEGDRIVSRGGDHLSSVGAVELSFDSVQAYADTLEYREPTDELELRGRARVDAPEYDLEGARIELATPEEGAREVRASGSATLTGADFLLQSERILLFAREEHMERLVALPAAPASPEGILPVDSAGPSGPVAPSAPVVGRPRAVADEFEITADSLEILAPNETLERLFAAGGARSVSSGRDSLTVESLPEIARRDWLEGDTIIVTFGPPDSLPEEAPSPAVIAQELSPPDTLPPSEPVPGEEESAEEGPSRRARIERIEAIASARSLYRLPPSDRGARPGVDPPAVHYVVGDRITIVLVGGEVDRMEVEGRTTGIHLEPLLPGRPSPEGSSR